MDLRVELNAQQKVIGATLRAGESLLQVSVFAAPRAGGIWDERPRGPREERLRAGRLAARRSTGPFGPELAGTILAAPPAAARAARRRSRCAGRPGSSASTARAGSCAA